MGSVAGPERVAATPFVTIAHANGVALIAQVGSLGEAEAAADAAVDAIIVQESRGGHARGTASVWELLPAVVETVAPVPVLASGGNGDGTGIARPLRLGAAGVSLGTRLVASDESRARYIGAGSPLATFEAELDSMPMWAGESVGVVHDVQAARGARFPARRGDGRGARGCVLLAWRRPRKPAQDD